MNCDAVCLLSGHVPVNFDPTGGDPFMGGPVMLTKCDRCEKALPESDAARLHNQYVGLLKKNDQAWEIKHAYERERKNAERMRANHWRACAWIALAMWVAYVAVQIVLGQS